VTCTTARSESDKHGSVTHYGTAQPDSTEKSIARTARVAQSLMPISVFDRVAVTISVSSVDIPKSNMSNKAYVPVAVQCTLILLLNLLGSRGADDKPPLP
jgi:hypothetical protein